MHVYLASIVKSTARAKWLLSFFEGDHFHCPMVYAALVIAMHEYLSDRVFESESFGRAHKWDVKTLL